MITDPHILQIPASDLQRHCTCHANTWEHKARAHGWTPEQGYPKKICTLTHIPASLHYEGECPTRGE